MSVSQRVISQWLASPIGARSLPMQIRNLVDLTKYEGLGSAHQAMSSDNQKRIGELRVFLGFLKASGLPIDPSSAVCFDPPYPDIRCEMRSSPHFFELAEITDQDLARSYNQSLKTGRITGSWFSQDEPLESIIGSKAQKTYETEGALVELVLYYWKQPSPYLPIIQGTFEQLKVAKNRVLLSGLFSRVWVYDHRSSSVLYVLPR